MQDDRRSKVDQGSKYFRALDSSPEYKKLFFPFCSYFQLLIPPDYFLFSFYYKGKVVYGIWKAVNKSLAHCCSINMLDSLKGITLKDSPCTADFLPRVCKGAWRHPPFLIQHSGIFDSLLYCIIWQCLLHTDHKVNHICDILLQL